MKQAGYETGTRTPQCGTRNVQIISEVLSGFIRKVITSEEPVHGFSVDSRSFCGQRYVAARLFQNSRQIDRVEPGKPGFLGGFVIEVVQGNVGRQGLQVQGKIRDAYLGRLGKNNSPLHDILQLPDVAGPGVLLQQVHGLGGDAVHVLSMRLGEFRR